MDSADTTIAADLRTLVDEYRTQCLWFLPVGYYPETAESRLRVLDAIQRHGDRAAHIRAAALRRCLLQNSNDTSAAS